jgi:hypothetical protein
MRDFCQEGDEKDYFPGQGLEADIFDIRVNICIPHIV